MAINKNHLFEDLEGVKCAIVESGVSETRKDFLKALLEFNGFQVVVSPEVPKAPPATPAPPPPTAESTEPPTPPAELPPPPPTTYKLGVTDVSFNTTNAIYGRLLHTKDGRVVTMAYWLQKESVSNDQVPYFDHK